jgi:hypothetical protein
LQTQVASAEYQVTFAGPVDASELKRKIDSVMEAESLLRERRGKPYNLRPLIEELSLTPLPTREEKVVRVCMRLAAREGATGRPEEVLDILGIAFEETRIERTHLIFRS